MEQARIGSQRLAADLAMPQKARGVVVFAHGSGSSRHSPRNRYVSDYLNQLGLGTLLMDLLSESEDEVVENRFDIGLLASRLEEALVWLQRHPKAAGLPVALFGASTGAATALDAAARRPGGFFAVVSRGGRPDLATEPLSRITAPVLLIVGGEDDVVLELNKAALRRLPETSQLEVIPGATHLFGEPGKLEAAAELAGEWFVKNLNAERDIRRSQHASAH